jgi:chemotaxis protein MotB
VSARRSRRPPAKTEQAWLATYGDMVTLLMAFFVMLFAISSVEQEKFDAFLTGLEQFGNNGGDPIGTAAAPIEPPLPSPDPATPELPEPPTLDPSLQALGEAMLAAVAAAGHPGAVEITHDERGLGVTIETDSVLFDVGSARITPMGEQIVAAVAPPLASVPNEILLEGHADTTPLNRNGYTNWNLSTDRAVAVVNMLIERHGMDPHRLTASGFGEFDPRDPGASPESKARNRRVELIVVDEALQ